MVDWKEAKAGDVVKLKQGERIEGLFVDIQESKKYSDSYALTIETKKGKQVLFVNNIVKDLITTNSIMKGQEIAVLFKGQKENESKTFKYNDFALLFK